MTRLKRWESPRREGRNDKGRGGSARKRQLRKQQQLLRKQLKANKEEEKINTKWRGKKMETSPSFLALTILWFNCTKSPVAITAEQGFC
jgi:ribosomal protein S19